jgi:hypothetical protein
VRWMTSKAPTSGAKALKGFTLKATPGRGASPKWLSIRVDEATARSRLEPEVVYDFNPACSLQLRCLGAVKLAWSIRTLGSAVASSRLRRLAHRQNAPAARTHSSRR